MTNDSFPIMMHLDIRVLTLPNLRLNMRKALPVYGTLR